jgi:hypothetical protein
MHVLVAGLRLPLFWAGAQVGTLLASLEESELHRFAVKQRTCWALLWLVSVVAAYLAGASGLTSWAPYLILSAALLLNVRWRTMLVNAGLDRTSTPIAATGRVRRLIVSREGGWPLLLQDQDGRWLWLTGQERDLERTRAALRRRRPGVDLELRLTLTYYPRTHVIKEITGMTVEERARARAAVPRLAPSPA